MTARPLLAAIAMAAVMFAPAFVGSAASAAPAPVGLGTAGSFAVLAGSAVTNTGPTVISGDLGVSPSTAVTGFPPGLIIDGTQHASDPVADIAQSDLTVAYNDTAGRTPTAMLSADLGGMTVTSGVYAASSALGLTGTVILDGEGDPAAVFIFQVGSTLIAEPNSAVALIGGAQACNVFWQVGSSTTLGVNSVFAGTVMSLVSTTVNTGTVVAGRVLARTGAVTLDHNVVTRPSCAAPLTTTTAAPTTTTAPPWPACVDFPVRCDPTQDPFMTTTTWHDLIPPAENSATTTSTVPPRRLPPCEPSNIICRPAPPSRTTTDPEAVPPGLVPPVSAPPVSLVPPRVLPPTGSPATGRLVVLGFAALAAGLGLRSLRR